MQNGIVSCGLMSGTSADGIDLSLIRTNGLDLEILDNFYFKYSDHTRKKIVQSLNNFTFKKLLFYQNKLNEFITKLHYRALKDSQFLKKTKIIGFHGQTIYHSSKRKLSVQLGNPKLLANLTKKTVVFDFRANDLIHGGQGAPLAPIYHQIIVKKNKFLEPCCFINIGGITNITYIHKTELIGFDAGPGNNLMDYYVNKNFNVGFDKNGFYASKGKININLVDDFMTNSYFKKRYPKSLDKNHFNKFFNLNKTKRLSSLDLISSLNEITLKSILIGINQLPKPPKTVVVSGGGIYNKFLMAKLKEKLNVNFINLIDFNIDPDFIESQLIAFLSVRSLYGLPITFPNTTGVKVDTTG